MKRKDLIKKLKKNGQWLLREGSNHAIYTNGKDNEPISRQTEIDELLYSLVFENLATEGCSKTQVFERFNRQWQGIEKQRCISKKNNKKARVKIIPANERL